MDRNREARRTTMAANGLSRRRHRSNSLRDSPEEDGPVELQEPARLRDRGSGKKDRDRERDRDRDRERDRDRSSRNKRRRGDRLIHGSNRDDGGEDSSEESVNDEEDEDDDVGGGSVRMLPLNPSSLSSTSLSNHRKSFPQAKDFRAAPTWKATDEMIGVSVPRKARSASTKRLHECWASNGGIMGEQFHRQASTSPVRTSVAAMGLGPSQSPASPSSSNASVRKKIKSSGPKLRPPKSSSKSSSAQDEIEIEIAEVLYGMRQPQGISKQETLANDLLKFDSRETNKSSGDGKSSVSSPISNSQSAPPLPLPVPPQNSGTSITPLSAVAAPKRKRPRPVKYEDDNPMNFAVRSSPISSTTKAESDQPSKVETCSPDFDKRAVSATENVGVSYDLANSQVVQASPEPQSESIKLEGNVSSECKLVTEESERQDVGLSKEAPQSPKKESSVPKLDDEREDVKATKANPTMSESGNQREEKFQIDLMAPPPPSRSSPERDVDVNFVAGDPKPMAVEAEMEAKPMVKEDDKSPKMNKEEAVPVETEKKREVAEGTDIQKPVNVQKERSIDLQIDLEKADKDTVNGNMVGKRHQQNVPRLPQPPNSEKAVHSSSVPVPISVPSWPGSLPPMGYMTPLQGVVSMDGTAVSSAAIPPPHLLFNQPRPKRCATHCYIARTISYNQQIARMNPFWPAAAAGSASLYGAKPCNLNVVPSNELQGNIVSRAANSAQDKGHSLTMFPGHIGKEKGSQAANMENGQRKQMLLQQDLPAGAPSNILHGPAFIFPLNQQQAAAAATVRPGCMKSLPTTATGNGASLSSSCTSNAVPASASAAAPTMSFSYPNMTGNETQYLAILQNNAYPFPIPAHVGGPPAYRGSHAQALPFFNGSFYSSQMLHPSQLQQPQSQQNQQGHQNSSMSSGKVPATVGQSIAFSRPDLPDPSVSAITGNTVLDSSARTINLGSASSRATAAVSSQQQVQRNQQQQHQLIQVQKPHQFAAVRSKAPSTSNGSAYSDHLPSASSMAATKFTNTGCAYPQNLAQSSSTAAQWKNSVRPTTTSQSFSPSMMSTPSSVKTVSQQQARSQQAPTQISFSANPKISTATQVQTSASTHSPSPPVMVGSPTTSSMSKSAGSPKTTSTSTGNKTGQASSLSTQQPKSSQAVPSRKSSPVGGRNVPSIFSGPQLTTSSSTGVKPQQQQQQQPQLISKQSLQQAQFFFSNAYMHPQASQSNSSTSTTSAASGYYLQRRGPDPHMQRQNPSGTSSNGMLSMCPAVTFVSTSSNDSSKVAAAASNIKGGGLPTQGFMHHPAHFAAAQPSGNHHQFVHASFPYAVPAAVQVKPAEQKQPAGE